MRASILDLRYKMNDVLKALDRNETVKIFYRGILKGEIQPVKSRVKSEDLKVEDHPFFGMHKGTKLSVEKEMAQLRKGRHNDI